MVQATKSFDLNSASVDELSSLRLVGRERAELIVNYRKQHGRFNSWEDLKNIRSFSQGMIDDIRRSGATINNS